MREMPTAQDQQILITRVFDAPRELVFQAWTDPGHVAQWFGPEGFDTPRESVTVDLRVGGRYQLGVAAGTSAGWGRAGRVRFSRSRKRSASSNPPACSFSGASRCPRWAYTSR